MTVVLLLRSLPLLDVEVLLDVAQQLRVPVMKRKQVVPSANVEGMRIMEARMGVDEEARVDVGVE